MKRAIKFRGKTKEGKWIYGSLGNYKFIFNNEVIELKNVIFDNVGIFNSDNFIYIINDHTVQKETICQFTGKYDRNGKEIYEGDIIRSDYKPFSGKEAKDNLYAIILWDEENYRFAWRFIFNINGKKRGDWPGTTMNIGAYKNEHIEVIGNIYDNPELIKEE